jgi:hypothetical protein
MPRWLVAFDPYQEHPPHYEALPDDADERASAAALRGRLAGEGWRTVQLNAVERDEASLREGLGHYEAARFHAVVTHDTDPPTVERCRNFAESSELVFRLQDRLKSEGIPHPRIRAFHAPSEAELEARIADALTDK